MTDFTKQMPDGRAPYIPATDPNTGRESTEDRVAYDKEVSREKATGYPKGSPERLAYEDARGSFASERERKRAELGIDHTRYEKADAPLKLSAAEAGLDAEIKHIEQLLGAPGGMSGTLGTASIMRLKKLAWQIRRCSRAFTPDDKEL
jgi:hypothetical protein